MKKCLIVFTMLSLPLLGFTQSRFFVNLNAGLDVTWNKYYSYNNYDFYDNDGLEYSFGADLGYKLSDVVRFRVESRYGTYSYGQDYTGSNLLNSEMTLTYFNINPRFDFRVWNKEKWELFVSPGLKLEFNSDSDQETVLSDGSTSDSNYVSSAYSDNMTGFIAGGILKYNINSKMGLTFSPEYTYYFKKLYDKNDGNMQRFSAKLGFEYFF